MPAEIENVNGQDCFVYVGQPAWHGLGTKVDDTITPIEMLKAAGLDWNVESVEEFYYHNGKQVPNGKKSLIRSTDGKFLSSISEDWKPVQNIEAFEFFNEFVEAGDMSMETAGSLKEGRHVWALAKTKDSFSLFNGDDVESYLLFSNPHEYGKTINIRFVATRVVCANTISIALSEESRNFVKFNHRAEFNPDLARELLGISHGYMDKYKEQAAFLGSKKASSEAIKEYLMQVFPSHSGNDNLSRAVKKIYDQNILDNQPGHDFAPGTWWNAYNSVTYYTNHLAGRTKENRLNNLWFGGNSELNLKALDLANDYAKAA